jgi:hypothetical protein
MMIAVTLLFGVMAILIFAVTNAGRNKALKGLADRFQGTLSTFDFWPTVRGKYQGFEFQVVLEPGSRNSPPQLVIRLVKPSVFTLRISRETALSRLGTKLHLINEIQINDPSFDKDFLIFSNHPVQTVHFLNSSAKSILRELFDAGFQVFRIDTKTTALYKPNYVLATDIDPARVEEILQKLITLSTSAV